MKDEGKVVKFRDEWKRKSLSGVVVGYRRNAKGYEVAVVKMQCGTEIEVHPSRLEVVK